MSSADRWRGPRFALVVASALATLTTLTTLASGCWLEPTTDPPPFDCANFDRADERFPAECGDAGVPDADVDAGP